EQLFGKLRRFGLVTSVRGPGGGYKLSRPMSEISVADIIVAVDEPIDARQCEGKEDCKGGQQCMTHHLWMDLNRKMFHYLSSVSLADLVKEQNQRMELREGAKKVTKKKLMLHTLPV
nr:Rrf2 family transcriptional regulator [Hydromonas sp.]